jgi:soluble lytic murein transglycosylase-like protein
MWRRLLALGLVGVAAAGLAVALLSSRGGPDAPRTLTPGAGNTETTVDPIAWSSKRRGELEQRAAAGLAHVIYAKSPGGAVVSAARTATWRPQVERAAKRGGVDPDLLEAIVLLESAGRPDAQASNDIAGAVGLTQILAETGQNLLGMRVDVRASARLTRGINRGHKVAARLAARRRVDERFDPEKALAATVRYLRIARQRLGRTDLAVAAYHMGIGNMQTALAAYGKHRIPYARLFFDSTPLRHARAYRVLAALGDDSSTYLWRVMAARNIMRLYREDPDELARQAELQGRKASAEEVLHPVDTTPPYGDPFAVGRARASGELVALSARRLAGFGVRIDPRMGELAGRLHQSPRLYRALRPQALRMLEIIGAGTRAIARTRPLIVTSTVRDEKYQRVLVARNREATRNFSLHTTGWAFDISRTYRSRAQARAFQFMLDRLTALNMIAWVREPGAIHVTVAAP